jgi:DNA polymerase III subunit beta
MVATDGHRLSLIERTMATPIKIERGVILPKKGLMELRRLLAEDGGPCELALTPGSLVFRREGVLMIIRLLEGVFPDYRQVIPKESARTLILKRSALIETLRRVSLIAQDKASGIKLEVGRDNLTLSSQNPDLGEAQEQVAAKVTGEPLKVGFNARYLIDVLTVLTSDEVQLDLLDDLSPGKLQSVGETGYLAVVMPMRI